MTENETFEIDEVVSLIENKKINELHKYLDEINSADFPSIIENITDEKLVMTYRLLSKDKAAEVFVELDFEDQERLINCLTDKEITHVMNEIYMDDAVDLIEEMPDTVVKRILANTKAENRKIINELLKYPEDTAGSMMTTEFIDLKETMTQPEALNYIKQKGIRKETVYNCYVLDGKGTLLGVVDIKELLAADKDKLIKDIMDTNVIEVSTLEDQEDVVKLFDKYDVIALPVVDKQSRLVGIITFDDAMDVMQEESLEDFEKMAAINPNDGTYLKTSAWQHAKNRIIWVLFLMISSIPTGFIIEHYEASIATLPLLVTFLPLVMNTGGNCGQQSSTLIIRGMAMDELSTKDVLKALWKEFRVAILVGIGLAIVNTIRIYIQYKDISTAIVVSGSLILTVIFAKLLGVILPMGAKKLKLDPALIAAPLLTTVIDILSVIAYFNIASVIFNL